MSGLLQGIRRTMNASFVPGASVISCRASSQFKRSKTANCHANTLRPLGSYFHSSTRRNTRENSTLLGKSRQSCRHSNGPGQFYSGSVRKGTHLLVPNFQVKSSGEESADVEPLLPKQEAPPLEVGRLFSLLNEATLKHEPGSLTSAILLVAGTTVGAGILAIPAVTKDAGFAASAFTCVSCWLYMVTTGLLIAEVCVNTMCELGSGGTSLVSMAERTLGKTGSSISIATYVFIHYALLVAYVARSTDIITNATGLPPYLSATVFTSALGGLCYFGGAHTVGLVNGALVVGVLGSFAVLVGATSSELGNLPLGQFDLTAIPSSIPIIIVAFVYQNVVPVIATDLEGDLSRIRTAVVAGTAIPLAMFLVWDAVILGTSAAASSTASSFDPLLQLRESSIGPVIEVFSLLAIATSYIGFVLGLSDFLADWLKLPRKRGQDPLPYALTLFPPLVLALLDPDIFFRAVDLAGTYGVLVLFGILPAAMAWSERYGGDGFPMAVPPLVPGGRFLLSAIGGTAAVIILSELVSHLLPS